MAPLKKRTPSPPSAEAIATGTSSYDSNPKQAKTSASSVSSSSSSSFHKGKRGRPKKLVISTRSDGDLKNSAGDPPLSNAKSPSGATATKKTENPEIPNSKNEKMEIAAAGEVYLKESVDPELSSSTAIATKKMENPEIPNSKNEKMEIAAGGEVYLKKAADPELNSSPAADNEGGAGDCSSNANRLPPPPNLRRKKSPRKGKPNRAPFY